MVEDKYKNIKLISCDIDGTLMNTNRMLSEEFVEMVKELRNLGVQFTFASGRLPYKIMPLASQINSDLPFVACNGGCIYQNGRFLFKKMFFIRILKDVINLAEILDDTILYSFDGIEYCLRETEESALKRQKRGSYYPVRSIKNEEWDKLKILKLNILSNKSISLLKHKLDAIKDEVDITYYGDFGAEIVPKGVNKRTGIKQRIEHMNLSLDEVIAIGDNENDLELLKNVGIGVAVQNATQEIKECSNLVTENCGEEGVVEFLEILRTFLKG